MCVHLQSLASAIAATKVLSAQQVVKNEAGEEVGSGHGTHILTLLEDWKQENSLRTVVRVHIEFLTSVLFNCFLQVFIPLISSGVEVQQNTAIPDYLPEEEESPQREVDRAISRTTAKEDSSGSWLNSAASFLTKTFYWWNRNSVNPCDAEWC